MSEKLKIPILPLRDVVVFPHMVVPLFVGRSRSVAAIEACAAAGTEILLVTQKESSVDDPSPEDIYRFGTTGAIVQFARMPDGTVKLLVEGSQRASIEKLEWEGEYPSAVVTLFDDDAAKDAEAEAFMRGLKKAFESFAKMTKKVPNDFLSTLSALNHPSKLADVIAAQLVIKLEEKQKLLETVSVKSRLEKLLILVERELEILRVEQKIRDRVRQSMEKTQKEYYLNEQMQAIQKELGERDEFKAEILEIEEKLARKNMPEEAREKVKKELKKLRMMSPMAAEAAVIRNYIDWVLSLPWNEVDGVKIDLAAAEKILNADHYGLENVKERILEYLAVQSRTGNQCKGQIICFVGPPGVGKTSLAKSIARAVNRRFVKATLGGVRDEAEIRGHRRTYVGALPGKIIQTLKKAGVNNPVFLLDEIDKMSMDFRGDPSAALLEVLDPEQNQTFNDHYLELDYDLSQIMFIATANTIEHIPVPLRDRMEMIRIPGYTDEEKLHIARKFLSPKQREKHGISAEEVRMSPNVLKRAISHYSREAGVRNLEREIATLYRKTAKKLVKGEEASPVKITTKNLSNYLGAPKFWRNAIDKEDLVGMANGLAWTEMGGELLNIEAIALDGKGDLLLTGQLGSVMQESAKAALSYVRSRAKALGLDPEFYKKQDIHIHVPEGAIPKDGPSAGISIAVAVVSALLKVPVKRSVAMTGEITLRGRILPVGGLKEKLLAAQRSGVSKVLLPSECRAQAEEVSQKIVRNLEILFVEHMDEVLHEALTTDLFEKEGVDLPFPQGATVILPHPPHPIAERTTVIQ